MPWLRSLRQWQYADDWILQCPVEQLPILLEAISSVLDDLRLPLQLVKCQLHVPSWIAGPPAGYTPPAGISYRAGGIELLGTSACGDLRTPLTFGEDIPAQTADRIAKALALARRACQLARAAPQTGGRQPAFAIARGIISHALDFDAGVLPCSVLLPYADQINTAVLEVVAASMDVDAAALTPLMRRQLWLPRRWGGLQLSDSVVMVPLARSATLMRQGPRLRETIQSWRYPPDGRDLSWKVHDPTVLDGVGTGQELLDHFHACGVGPLSGNGTPQDQGCTLAEDPLRPAHPADKLLSKLLRSAADAAAATLYSESPPDDQIRLLSAGGPSAGSSLVAPLSMDGVHFSDWQWSEALRWRLGFTSPGCLARCQNQAHGQQGVCGTLLDPGQDHAVDCEFGPLRTRRHDGIADVYADIAEECGALARREVFVQELTGAKEAWLDVWAYGIHGIDDLLLDITVRHPRAARYRPRSEAVSGAAAAVGEREKYDRYPAAAGRSVWPVSYETWGRAGEAAETLLVSLAAAARHRAHRRGRACGQELARWRARIDGTLQRAVVAQLAAAHHGLPGRRAYRARPLDLASLEASTPV